MNKEENKVNFDLSNLSLSELVTLYEKVIDFLQYLDNQKINEEGKEEESNG